MEFRILGSLEVWDGPRQIQISGAKRRGLLALLVLHANEVVGKDRLIDQLWGERAPATAPASLHNSVSRLRKALGPDVLSTRAWGYALRVDPALIDLHRFERLIADAEPLPAKERSAKLAQALALWRGPPLADLSFEPALANEIARLEELRLSVLEARIDADLESGHSTPLIGELEALIAEHPLRERLRGQLILALYRDGRQAEALEVYRETRRLLADQLGLEPSPALRELEQSILRQDPQLAPAAPAERPLADAPPGRRRWPVAAAFVVAALAAAAATAALLEFPHRESAHLSAPQTIHTTTLVVVNKSITIAPPRTRETARQITPAKSRRASPRPQTRSTPSEAAAAATSSTRTAPKTVASQRPRRKAGSPHLRMIRIADPFSASTINSRLWTSGTVGTGVAVAQGNGQLRITMSADAVPDPPRNIAGFYWGACSFTGDFDMRIDYTLLSWPPANGTEVALLLSFVPSGVYFINMVRESSAAGQENYVFEPPRTPARSVATSDTSGGFRFTRIGSRITGYYRAGARWVKLGSTNAQGYLRPVLYVGAGSDFAHKDVAIAFDSFTVSAPLSETCLGYPK